MLQQHQVREKPPQDFFLGEQRCLSSYPVSDIPYSLQISRFSLTSFNSLVPRLETRIWKCDKYCATFFLDHYDVAKYSLQFCNGSAVYAII